MNGFARKKWASFQEAAAMRTIDNCIAPCMEEKELQSLYSGWREAVKKVIGQNN
jgi:glycerol kinase 2